MNPDEIRAFLEYLMGSRTPTPSQLPSDVLGDWGDDLNNLNRAASRAADPSYLITNQMVDPAAFDPITTYEPVQVPGRQLLDQYYTNGNPLQSRIAELIDQGRLGSQILIELQSDPELAQYAPRQMVQGVDGSYEVSDQPDWRSVQDEIENVTSALASDPAFDQEFFQRTGQYMSAETNDSPLREKAMEMGFVSTPGEPYDPYMFAEEGRAQTDAEQEAARVAADLSYAQTELRRQREFEQLRDAIANNAQFDERQRDAQVMSRGSGAPVRKARRNPSADEWNEAVPPSVTGVDVTTGMPAGVPMPSPRPTPTPEPPTPRGPSNFPGASGGASGPINPTRPNPSADAWRAAVPPDLIGVDVTTGMPAGVPMPTSPAIDPLRFVGASGGAQGRSDIGLGVSDLGVRLGAVGRPSTPDELSRQQLQTPGRMSSPNQPRPGASAFLDRGMDQALEQRRRRAGQASTQAAKDKNRMLMAQARDKANQRDAMIREAIARKLLQSGFSPFDDEVRRRNQMMYGG